MPCSRQLICVHTPPQHLRPSYQAFYRHNVAEDIIPLTFHVNILSVAIETVSIHIASSATIRLGFCVVCSISPPNCRCTDYSRSQWYRMSLYDWCCCLSISEDSGDTRNRGYPGSRWCNPYSGICHWTSVVGSCFIWCFDCHLLTIIPSGH